MTRPLALALLLAPAPAAAQPSAPPAVRVAPDPAPDKWVEAQAAPGKPITLVVDRPARWRRCSDGCTLVPFPDGSGAVFAAADAGVYKVFASAGDELTGVIVRVGQPQPAPPVPVPPPAPPAPPAPPVDPFAAMVRAAFLADATPARREAALNLAAVYAEAAKLARSADVATTGQLAERVRKAAASLAADALLGVRKFVAAELAGLLGTADGPLDDAGRAKAADLFARAAAALAEAAK